MKKKHYIILFLTIAGWENNLKAQVCFAATNYAAGTEPTCVVSADFNDDGKMDLATGNIDSENVTILLGDGSGGFSAAAENFPVGGRVRWMTSSDYNEDGKIDLATSNYIDGSVSVLLGDGVGGFSKTDFLINNGYASLRAIVSADLNGDDNVDLAMNNWSSIVVLLGNGYGGFSTTPKISLPGTTTYYESVITSDFNADGKIDLATAGGSEIAVLLGDGSGSFSTPTSYTVGSLAQCIISADFDGDGKIDLATGNGGSKDISVLIGDGSGGFSKATNFLINNGWISSITNSDFNADGKMDLAAANSGNVSVLLGDGSGNFSIAASFTTGTSTYSIVSSDFNGDGKRDLATANNGSNNVSVLLNTTIPTPVISENGNILTSSSAIGNQWYLNGNLISGATNQQYEAFENGDYTVVVESDGCSTVSAKVSVNITGIEKISEDNAVNIFPNPTSGNALLQILSTENTSVVIGIYDLLGQNVHTENVNLMNGQNQIPISTNGLSNGVYLVKINSNSIQISTSLVIQK